MKKGRCSTMLKQQYFVTERIKGQNLFDKGRTIIHLATMDKVRAEDKFENLRKTYSEKADNFKIERRLININ